MTRVQPPLACTMRTYQNACTPGTISDVNALNYNSVLDTAHLFTFVYWILIVYPAFGMQYALYVR